MDQIKRTKLYEEVIIKIKELISTGKIQPGGRLPSEREMSELFGVSRIAVREAMSVLETGGVIDVRHGSGIYLNDINEKLLSQPLTNILLPEKENLLNLLELRKNIEGEAAYLAAQRATEANVTKLETILNTILDEIYRGITKVERDYDFHHALAEATGNPAYVKVMDVIKDTFDRGLRVSQKALSRLPQRPVEVFEEHKFIVEKIKKGDAEGAKKALRDHLDSVEENIRVIIEEDRVKAQIS